MDDKTKDTKKLQMTEEERIELCKKMDKELDDFIDGLEKKRYADGWPEDRWEEEMDKHPFFMKTVPKDGELSPLAEGLAKLKYDPNENTPLELATSYKEDGNFNFKHKNYRMAIIGYTEGIKVKSDNVEINASLYNNRAAAHWHLKNYRSSFNDAERALSFKPDHDKARLRAVKAALEIGKYDICIVYCHSLLEKLGADKEIIQLLTSAKKRKLIKERDERKMMRMDSMRQVQTESLVEAIKQRGIRIFKCKNLSDADLPKLEPTIPGTQHAMVRLEDGILKWPVLFLYPEFVTTDFVKGCPEDLPLINQMTQLFPSPWDERGKYTCTNVNVYYKGRDRKPHCVNPFENLGDLLLSPSLVLKAGTPKFFIVMRGSRFEATFLKSFE